MSNPELEQYRDAYFTEATDLMGSFVNLLVEFERHPESQTRLQELFRLAHTIKGMSAMMGFQVVAEFVHQWEQLLDELRQHRLTVNAAMISALLTGADALAVGLEHLKAREEIAPTLFAPVLEKLKAAQKETGSAPAPVTPAPPPTDHPTDHPAGAPAGSPSTPGVDGPRGFAQPSPGYPSMGVPVGQTPRGEPSGASHPTGAPVGSFAQTPGEKPQGALTTTLRVDVHLLDELLNLVGEMVIAKTRLQQLAAHMKDEALERTVHYAHRIMTRMQEKVLDARVVPIREVLHRFPRLVRDLSFSQGKDVELVIEGADVGMDRAIIEGLVEPLTHLINNAVTHGIEPTEVRVAHLKPPKGRIVIAVRREQGSVAVEVKDDGAGMDPERLKQKGIQMGLLTVQEAAKMSDREALMLITLPGFSTAETVTTAAGRGVGMDVVREKIQKMQGTLALETVKGQGSTVRLQLPFTLTILRTLLVKAGSLTFSLPFLSVKELKPAGSKGETSMPVRSLAAAFGLTPASTSPSIVVLESGNRLVALEVDQLLTQQEVVVKPLPLPLQGMTQYAGATILGDGAVSLILDLNGLFALLDQSASHRDLCST